MRHYRLPTGELVFEDRADHIRNLWLKVRAGKAKGVCTKLYDGRPAIRRTIQDFGEDVAYYTFNPVTWETIQRRLKSRLRDVEAWEPPPRTKLCEACAAELAVVRELEGVWIFRCPLCNSVETHSKALVGGQIGAGERERIPSGKREL